MTPYTKTVLEGEVYEEATEVAFGVTTDAWLSRF